MTAPVTICRTEHPIVKYLIVEDDPNLRLLWNAVLSGRGYDVVEAETVEAARAALRADDFDVMVLDLYLGRENGLSLANFAESVGTGCKVIIVTGAAGVREEEIRAVSEAIVSVHRKPVDIEDLIDVCARLEGHTMRRASL